jgi:hypothetical protein
MTRHASRRDSSVSFVCGGPGLNRARQPDGGTLKMFCSQGFLRNIRHMAFLCGQRTQIANPPVSHLTNSEIRIVPKP